MYSYIFNKRPSDTVTRFQQYLCDGDIENIEKIMSASVSLPKEVMRLGWASGLRECKENGGLQKVEVSKTEIKGEIAGVFGNTIYKKGKSEGFAMKLYLEKGEWKIAFNPDVMQKSLENSLKNIK